MIRIKVKELLEKQGHSKYWLYKRMGLSYQNISKIMDGETNGIRYENLERLCKLLQCTPNDLFEIEFADEVDELIEEADRRSRKRSNKKDNGINQDRATNELKKPGKRGRPPKKS